ncbi:putative sulfate transporter/MT1781 [Maliponia aquimaris]|uniref:Putative sulfate transporter/MT1781 n=2 Tax=Maliponia aquimaris TaxID=1673631 RepID=A0A238L6N0_9RHOB|nr:putative sulfate transporter/MT1781 [Maliponia aquimaris]
MLTIARVMFGASVIALISAVFAISFAAIIYQGALSPFLDRGIGLVLLGAAVISITGAFALSDRALILAPQDIPAVLLAGSAATFVAGSELSGEVLFSTVACLIAVSSVAMGLMGMAVGQLRLAYIARYVPYPVIAGFLAATGLLLLLGGLGVALGDSPAGAGVAGYLTADALFKWVPPLVAALFIAALTRLVPHGLTLPAALAATGAGFYALLWAFGISHEQALSEGLLLSGAADGILLQGLSPAIPLQADWGAILTQTPVILTIIGSCLLGATLNASGLELAFRRDFDISREVKGTGIANVLAGLVGGLPGYHIVAENILANRLGLGGRLPGLSAALGCLAVLLLGANALSGLPIGFFAAVLTFLGVDLLVTWIWEERRRHGPLDHAIVVLIPVVAVAFGFLTAVAVGLVAAAALFIVAYARLSFIRSDSDLATRRSFVERPGSELTILAETGAAARIVELSSFLFFGSAHALRDRIRGIISTPAAKVQWLVLDFGHTTGVDISTLQVLRRLASDFREADIRLVVSGLSEPTHTELRKALAGHDVDYFRGLNDALECVEDTLIARYMSTTGVGQGAAVDDMAEVFSELASQDFIERMELDAGQRLMEFGARSDDIYFLLSGRLSVSLPGRMEESAVVARVRPRAVIGEMAYYSGNPRSADIIATEPSVVLRLDMGRIGVLERENPAAVSGFHKAIAGSMARRLNRTTRLLRDFGA